MKSNILILAEGYFPAQNYGGPPVSIKNFCELLKEDFNFYIVTKDNDLNEQERLNGIDEGWNSRFEAQVLYLSKKENWISRIKNIIKKLNPDLIYINSFFDYKLLSSILLTPNKIPILIAPRGQLLDGAMSNKKLKKTIYLRLFKLFYTFRKNVYFQSTSQEEEEVLKHLFSPDSILTFTNIPSKTNEDNNVRLKKPNSLHLVFLSRIVSKKNLDYAIDILTTLNEEISLDIFGPIEDKKYWNLCEDKISTLPKNIKVKYKGNVRHEMVGAIFSQYDAFLFPTKSENYGHVISESLLNDCPVIISDKTPWNDIENGEEGYVCSLDNVEEFRQAIKELYYKDEKEHLLMKKKIKNYMQSKIDFSKLKNEISTKIEKIIRK